MTERMYGGYPESCVRDGMFQLEGEQVIAIVRDLLAENAALRTDLDRVTRGTWSKEIARVTAENAALREALTRIASNDGRGSVHPSECDLLRVIASEALNQPQREGDCQCPACKVTPHASDCAVHNAPALPVGPCDCGAVSLQDSRK